MVAGEGLVDPLKDRVGAEEGHRGMTVRMGRLRRRPRRAGGAGPHGQGALHTPAPVGPLTSPEPRALHYGMTMCDQKML